MILKFEPALPGPRTHELSDLLAAQITKLADGELDGHDTAVDQSATQIYAYGPDAEALYRAALEITPAPAELARCSVYLRFGDVNDHSAAEMNFQFGQELNTEK